ncbi:uncharacterized protein LOC110369132 [Fundulus heteroclitus]|uniref:uncharacterized protein LOC110369132 n=1 Tax=Fundulus heteroclitus TaxID=8078 RepID=UPI00165B5C0D|nr:uncharacterized protein LOC110369132 [Fundulus heteroclitus]
MKTHLRFCFLSIQLFQACAEVVFRRLTEDQSLVLSCIPQQEHGRLVGLHLYRHGPQSQTTLLSVAEGAAVRVDPGSGARLQLTGALDSPRINVSISHLQLGDTGLYMWELSYRQKNSSDQVVLGTQQYFLLVEGEGSSCRCAHSYIPLLLTISAATGLLLLAICLLATEKCVRLKHRRPPQPHSPIYEEMNRKQQSTGSPKISREASLRQDEVCFPVYANPNIRQPQDNYYACPRQLALRA